MTSRWRYVPRNMDQVCLCLEDQADDRMVEADPDTGVTEKTVGEVRARTAWPSGLVLVVPSGDSPGAAVQVVKSEL